MHDPERRRPATRYGRDDDELVPWGAAWRRRMLVAQLLIGLVVGALIGLIVGMASSIGFAGAAPWEAFVFAGLVAGSLAGTAVAVLRR